MIRHVSSLSEDAQNTRFATVATCLLCVSAGGPGGPPAGFGALPPAHDAASGFNQESIMSLLLPPTFWPLDISAAVTGVA